MRYTSKATGNDCCTDPTWLWWRWDNAHIHQLPSEMLHVQSANVNILPWGGCARSPNTTGLAWIFFFFFFFAKIFFAKKSNRYTIKATGSDYCMKTQHDYDGHEMMRMFTKCNPNFLMPKVSTWLCWLEVDAQISNCCWLGAKFFFLFFFFSLSLAPRSWWETTSRPLPSARCHQSQGDPAGNEMIPIMKCLWKSSLSLLNSPHRVVPPQVLALRSVKCSLSLMWSTRSTVIVVWRARCSRWSEDDAHTHQVSAQARCFNCHCSVAASGDGQGIGCHW